MAAEYSLVSRKVKCPNEKCQKTFIVERYGMQNRAIKDKCPFCQTRVLVKL